MKIGFLGLGRMGSRMVKKLLADGHEVIVWNRSQGAVETFMNEIKATDSGRVRPSLARTSCAKTIQETLESLSSPKVLWLMLPAGKPTDDVLTEISKYVVKDDIIIDGGNAYYKDTEKRYKKFEKNGIRFLGIGVSGGIKAAENGFPLMVGGDRSAYEFVQPILKTLSKPHGGYDYFGIGGAGHFVKMVHNGIEYGMMQAIGEGFGIMESSKYEFDLQKVAKIWQKGTIISSFLIDCAADALQKDPQLTDFTGPIGENGEATWTIEEAEKEKIAIPVIRDALQYRLDSQKSKKLQKSFVARMVSALRFAFGGHAVKK